VLAAAGHRVRRRQPGPAGLTRRELEVLRLLAGGLSTKQIAQQLVISRKPVRNHVQHVYAKTGVSNRAQASLFAVKHGLLSDIPPLCSRSGEQRSGRCLMRMPGGARTVKRRSQTTR
ncbi:MAG TPA: response regulator transcription factor, partial [Solirubrobacteraceae bacterium]|nr:response regulator transcription factor [Solirubrobacteraceae bacterium]